MDQQKSRLRAANFDPALLRLFDTLVRKIRSEREVEVVAVRRAQTLRAWRAVWHHSTT